VESSWYASNGFLAVAGEETLLRPFVNRRLENADPRKADAPRTTTPPADRVVCRGRRLQAQLSRPVEPGARHDEGSVIEVVIVFAGWNISAIVALARGDSGSKEARA
jgi:hypothetical protein